MNNQDTFTIICSFLNPKELIKFRFLSNNHNKWTDKYLNKTFKKINIEEYICPKCANWLDNKEDISNYNEFSEHYLTDLIKQERFQSIKQWINNKHSHYDNYDYYDLQQEDIERSNILCDQCEYEEDYSDNIFENFKYKGSREYNLVYFYGIYSWVALYLIKDVKDVKEDKNKRKALWNEYRKPLSICYKEYTVCENSNENPYYFNQDEEDENILYDYDRYNEDYEYEEYNDEEYDNY